MLTLLTRPDTPKGQGRRRHKISPMAKAKVLERCGGACEVVWDARCEVAGSQFHHVLAHSEGGQNVATNLLLACNACHEALHGDEAQAMRWGLMRRPAMRVPEADVVRLRAARAARILAGAA
jgi:5-methylcytosine-specific restriction endonuclease McrA